MQFTRMFQAVEAHSGIPMRVITGGVPTIPGETVYQQTRTPPSSRPVRSCG